MMLALAILCLALTAIGCLYLVNAIVAVRVFALVEQPPAEEQPPVTILKPLHGAEPGLKENLASFCRQDYAGPVQIVFGLQDGADPALAIAEALAAEYPHVAIVVDAARHGTNAKVSNLVNMSRAIAHDIVVLADSDMRVGPDYLARVVGALERPGAGGVTCLYHGIAGAGIWSRLGALGIDTHFLPNAIFGVTLGLAKPGFGSTIALRRETLDTIGGFASLANVLADDFALCAAIRRTAGPVLVPPFAIGHVFGETSISELWRHEIRWSRTIRNLDPVGHIGSLVTHPLALGLIGLALATGSPRLVLTAKVLVALAIVLRVMLSLLVSDAFRIPRQPFWLCPVRDLLSFGVFVTSFVGRRVTWKSHDFRLKADGNLVSRRRPPLP